MDHLDGTMFVDRADPETLETVPLKDEEGGVGIRECLRHYRFAFAAVVGVPPPQQ